MSIRAASCAFAVLVSAAIPFTHAYADVLAVPEEFPTIQSAIDAASNGSVVLVGPGIYRENLDFLGKGVAVIGSGPESVIDGGGMGSVARFVRGESALAVLDSFTITGGLADSGGAIEIRDSSPGILRNVIIGNSATSVGSGIYVSGITSEPYIMNNLMVFNTGVEGGDPHTIQVNSASPRIWNNTIARNDSNAILTSGSGVPDIRNNIFARNGSRTEEGARGRGICDFAAGTTTQYNLFFRNVRSAILTAGRDFRSIRRAERELQRARLANNLDGPPRFAEGGIPRTIEEAVPSRFVPSSDPDRPSRIVGAGDPSPAFNNPDGSRNTIGFTGGPFAF